MRNPIETIRLSQRAKDQLIGLKRHTGIKNWNVLCRWAVCVSLAEEAPPPAARIPTDSSVEMTWRVFGGECHELYLALIRQRCHDDGLGTDDETVATQFRLHLHRGVGYLAGLRRLRSIDALVGLVPEASAVSS